MGLALGQGSRSVELLHIRYAVLLILGFLVWGFSAAGIQARALALVLALVGRALNGVLTASPCIALVALVALVRLLVFCWDERQRFACTGVCTGACTGWSGL